MQSFIQKQKTLTLGPKVPYLGIFSLQFTKDYYQIFNQETRISKTINLRPNQQKINLGPKKLYLGF